METSEQIIRNKNGIEISIENNSKIIANDARLDLRIGIEFEEVFLDVMRQEKNYVLVFDKSLSMIDPVAIGRTKWDDIVQAVDTLKKSELGEFHCLFFSSREKPLESQLGNVQLLDKIVVRGQEINPFHINGTDVYPERETNIAHPFMMALEHILSNPKRHEMDSRVILFTDGLANIPYSTEFFNDLENLMNTYTQDDEKNEWNLVINELKDFKFRRKYVGNNWTKIQVKLMCKFFKASSIKLHILALGLHRDIDLLNESINNSLGFIRSIEENKADELLKVQSADDPFFSHSSFLVTTLLQEQSKILDEVKIEIVIKNLASDLKILDVQDPTNDSDALTLPIDDLIVGKDLVLKKILTGVLVENPPEVSHLIFFDTLHTDGIKEFNIIIKINQFKFKGVLKVLITDSGEVEMGLESQLGFIKEIAAVYGKGVFLTKEINKVKKAKTVHEIERIYLAIEEELEKFESDLNKFGLIQGVDD